MAKDKGVSIKVHTKFFSEVFEPSRKELEGQTGMSIGQIDFTKFLHKNKLKLKIPKNRFNVKVKKPMTGQPLSKGFGAI